MERCMVICDGCEKIFTGEKDESGNLVVPFKNQQCDCGSEEFTLISEESESDSTR